MSKKRTEYAVKVGTKLYVARCAGDSCEFFDEDDVTTEVSQARRWPLTHIASAVKVAEAVGGQIVRIKTKRKRIVTSVSDV